MIKTRIIITIMIIIIMVVTVLKMITTVRIIITIIIIRRKGEKEEWRPRLGQIRGWPGVTSLSLTRTHTLGGPTLSRVGFAHPHSLTSHWADLLPPPLHGSCPLPSQAGGFTQHLLHRYIHRLTPCRANTKHSDVTFTFLGSSSLTISFIFYNGLVNFAKANSLLLVSPVFSPALSLFPVPKNR